MSDSKDIERWKEYQQRTANIRPRSLLQESIPFVKVRKNALDLGAGALNDAEFMLEQGFEEVVAVDITPQFRELTGKPDKFLYFQQQFKEYVFPAGHFDLISAQYSLPFDVEGFPVVWAKIYSSLKSGGILTCQLFSTRDDWFGRQNMIFHTVDEVQKLTDSFVVLKMEECEYTEKLARGKHWHYFDLILQKPS